MMRVHVLEFILFSLTRVSSATQVLLEQWRCSGNGPKKRMRIIWDRVVCNAVCLHRAAVLHNRQRAGLCSKVSGA